MLSCTSTSPAPKNTCFLYYASMMTKYLDITFFSLKYMVLYAVAILKIISSK